MAWPSVLISVKKIVAAFPDGWLSSGQISREGAFPPRSFASSVVSQIR